MTIFLSSRAGSTNEDAMRLGNLRKRRQGGLLVEALKIVEPRLQSLEDNSASGSPMIWGDIGLEELVPLPVMGEGMTRIARLVLAISSAKNGVILVDEIENGIHHSVMEKAWQAVYAVAQKFNTQIIATTHSYECLEAAKKSLSAEDIRVHRLERVGTEIRCTTYEPSDLDSAILHQLEVR